MARSDYESLVAPKPIVEKIEKFQKEEGYPSKSQALGAIVNEMEKLKAAHESIAVLIEELRKYIKILEEGLPKAKAETMESVDRILSVIVSILGVAVALKAP